MSDNPSIYRIDPGDLRDPGRLGDLYIDAVRARLWKNSNRAMLEFAALAEKAVADDTAGTPEKLFASLLRRENAGHYVTNANEKRALERFPSPRRDELVMLARTPAERQPVTAGLFDLDTIENLGFSHSILMQCFLPQGRKEGREHIQHHGRVSLVVRAGWRMDPSTPGALTPAAIPWGSRARLVLHYVTSEAIRTQNPEIDMGQSLRNFLHRIGVPIGGKNARLVTEQVHDVAGADIILSGWEERRAVQHRATVANTVSFWLEYDERQQSFWRPSMTLSREFFEAINSRPVPMDSRHIALLGRSARRIDLYCWLTYRTAGIPRGQAAVIPLNRLQPIFAPDMAAQHARQFRAMLRRDLVAIAKLHPFQAEVKGDLLRLRRTRPPIPHRASTLLGGGA